MGAAREQNQQSVRVVPRLQPTFNLCQSSDAYRSDSILQDNCISFKPLARHKQRPSLSLHCPRNQFHIRPIDLHVVFKARVSSPQWAVKERPQASIQLTIASEGHSRTRQVMRILETPQQERLRAQCHSTAKFAVIPLNAVQMSKMPQKTAL